MAREILAEVARFGPVGLDATFAECIRDGAEGNFDVLELGHGAAALTVLAAAHGLDVPGRDIVAEHLDEGAMAAIRAQGYLVAMGGAAAQALRGALDGGLLRDLGTPPEVVPGYRHNIDRLSAGLDRLERGA